MLKALTEVMLSARDKQMIQRKKKVRFIKGHQNQQTLTENNKKKVIRFNKNQK